MAWLYLPGGGNTSLHSSAPNGCHGNRAWLLKQADTVNVHMYPFGIIWILGFRSRVFLNALLVRGREQ